MTMEERFLEIATIVESEFSIKGSYVAYGIPTFILEEGLTKEPFKKLAMKLGKIGLLPLLRRIEGKLTLKVIKIPKLKPSKISVCLLLFIATIGTVFSTGIFHGFSLTSVLRDINQPAPDISIVAILFTLSIFAIFGLHEIGHKILSMEHGIDCSPPYFIPCPPIPGVIPVGTLGAFIIQREFPVNRDELFDIGFAGPVIGFLTMIAVAVIGFQLSPLIPRSLGPVLGLRELPSPLLFRLLSRTRPIPPDLSFLCHPVLYAAWVGAFATFLNSLPFWQLDGGHVARALFGKEGHRICTFLSVIIPLFLGMAMLALFLLFFLLFSRGIHPGPLDEVSPLSLKRKLSAATFFIMIIICAPLPPGWVG